MKRIAIVAMSLNRVIGRDGELAWHIPEDLARFKRLTMGKPLIMGRKTHESIGRALPGRRNIVLSRSFESLPGCEVARSIEAAERLCQGEPEVCIIGGADVYESYMDRVDVLHLTLVLDVVAGDTLFFHSLDNWNVASREFAGTHVYLTLTR